MKCKLCTVFLFTFLSLSLNAEDIDNLLNDFKLSSELSNKTKDEARGNLIVYTRDDIERMQANTLKDLMKSLRFLGYKENRLGQPDLYNADPNLFNSSSVRIYLNENELFNPLLGSGFSRFGDMELDFIDHIEIYQGFPSFEIATEPATIVIRLYSKTAEHDAGGKIKAQMGSYGSNLLSTYYAQEFDDFSYFAYASRQDNQYKNISTPEKALKKDKLSEQFFFSFEGKNNKLELHAAHESRDALMGGVVSITSPLADPNSNQFPEDGKLENLYLSASWTSYFQDKSLIFNLSIMSSETDYSLYYTPSNAYRPLPSLGGQVQLESLKQTTKEDSFTLGLIKKFNYKDNQFTLGAKFRHKHFDLTDISLVSDLYIPPGFTTPLVIEPYSQAYYSTDISSFFLEDSYSLDENQIVSLSFMYQNYHNKHSSVDDINLFQARLGYILNKGNFVSKTFLSHMQFAPEPYMTIAPADQYSNQNLKENTFHSILQEFSYQNNFSLSKVILGYNSIDDVILIDPNTLQLRNNKKSIATTLASIEETLFFSQNDKLELQAYVNIIDAPYDGAPRQHYHGGMIRMLNSVDKFDFFNEFIIHEKQNATTSNGHDYNLGLIYHATEDLKFNIKGENIFDDGFEQSYIDQINTLTQETSSTVIPITQRRFWFGMELVF